MPNTTKIQIALSIRQPWAWLIIRPDLIDPRERAQACADDLLKDFENRTWCSNYHGGLLIHAGKTSTWQEHFDCQQFLTDSDIPIQLPPLESLQRGGIIGSVHMHGTVDKANSKWFTGPVAFQFSDPRIIPFHPFKGSLGFFQV